VGLAASHGSGCAAALDQVAPWSSSSSSSSSTADTTTPAASASALSASSSSPFGGNGDEEEGAMVRACADAVYAPNARILLTAAGCTAADLIQHCESATSTASCLANGPFGIGDDGNANAGKDAKLVLLGSVVLLLCYCMSCFCALALIRALCTCVLKYCMPAPKPVEDGTASSEASEAYDDGDNEAFNKEDFRGGRQRGHGGEVELAPSSRSNRNGGGGVALAAAATSEAAARIGGSLRGALEAAASRAHGQGQYAPLSPHAPDDDDDVGSAPWNRSEELENGGGSGGNSSVLENSAIMSMHSFTEDSDVGTFLDGRTPMKAPQGEIVD